jgi:SHS2 domain-containing protein
VNTATGFRLLEHTADMGIEAWAVSLEDVFVQTARGLRSLMIGDCPTGRDLQHKVRLEAGDNTELLVTWLNEIIYRFDTMNLVPDSFQIDRVGGGGLQATIHGEVYDPGKHRIERQAKAATYHRLLLEKCSTGWHARVYIDL